MRKPLELYKRLIKTQISEETLANITVVAKKFSDYHFAGQTLSIHLTRFMVLISRLVASLENRLETDGRDALTAIDVLDYFASTSKWWTIDREEPGFIIRPSSRDPRESIKSLSHVVLSGSTLARINGAAERLDTFLMDHNIGPPTDCAALRDAFTSTWALLSACICKNQGRTNTTESDFEIAYDILRILLFYTPREDFRALTAIRHIARHPHLSQVASVTFSAGFENLLTSSSASKLEAQYVPSARWRLSSATRFVLTNSLRLLVQLEAVHAGLEHVTESDYTSLITRALERLELVGVSPTLFQDEASVIHSLKRMPKDTNLLERLDLLTKKLENLIADFQSRDFLLHNARLITRMVSLLLLLSAMSTSTRGESLHDTDIKRGLLLLETVFHLV